MSGFWNSLRAELWAMGRRRNLRVTAVLIVAAVFARMLWAWLALGLSTGGMDDLASNHYNFWPRFGQALGFGFTIVELAVLVIIGGALPREIRLGAVRDPLCRGISRSSFVLSRVLCAAILPLMLSLVAVVAAASAGAIFFDAGHVVTDPVMLDPDPEGQQAFRAWLEENDLRADQVAVALDNDSDFLIPDQYYPFVPILIATEEDISGGIITALWQALFPLVVLGLFAFMVSLLLPTGALASGLALGAVLVFGVLLAPELGDRAWWCFADWLPGMGSDSSLKLATHYADGFSDVPPLPDRAFVAARFGNFAAVGVFVSITLWCFHRKRI